MCVWEQGNKDELMLLVLNKVWLVHTFNSSSVKDNSAKIEINSFLLRQIRSTGILYSPYPPPPPSTPHL